MGKSAMKLYNERKAKGLCPRCGRIPPPGYTLCEIHVSSAQKANARYRRRYRQKQKDQLQALSVIYMDDEPATTPTHAPKPVPATACMPVHDNYNFSRTADVQGNTRKCHDCKKPTTDYRCPTCLAKWKRKHNVTALAFGDEP